MKTKYLLFVFIIFFSSCKKDINAPNDSNPEVGFNQKELISSSNSFGFKLFREINKFENPQTNIFISPLSISFALGMTLNGADGDTYNAMRSTLDFGNMDLAEIDNSYKDILAALNSLDPKTTVQIANSIWYRTGFDVEKPFIELCRVCFSSEVKDLDFNLPNASDIINGWVELNTNGRIKNLIDKQIKPETVMFLINAIYFKSVWQKTFDEKATHNDRFYYDNINYITCQMMNQASRYLYLDNSELQMIDLPYGKSSLSMTVILPKSGVDLNSIVNKFSGEYFDNLINNSKIDSVKLYLPKFKIEYSVTLNDVLTSLGMGVAFTGAANFTKINKAGGLMISNVKHKSFIEVNEEGTEAAAATVVEIIKTSMGEEDNIFYANRPFLFLIRERTSNTILFMGSIYKPQ